MATINISIPDKLKEKAQELVDEGYYASFSDLVRTSLRETVSQDIYDFLLREAKRDEKEGKAVVLETKKDIDDFINSL